METLIKQLRARLQGEPGVPLRRAIRDGLAEMITTGQLQAPSRLPAIRSLAQQLEVSALTVSNVYQDLAREGLIHSAAGRGTVVCPIPAAGRGPGEAGGSGFTPDASKLAPPTRLMRLRDILTAGEALGHTMLTRAYGDPGGPVAAIYVRALKSVVSEPPRILLEHEWASGREQLRQIIASMLVGDGSGSTRRLAFDDILITTSGQSSLDLVTRTFLSAGDSVIVEEPTYFGALDLFENQGVTILRAPVDERGIRVDAVAALLQANRPKLVYLTPCPHAPSGVPLDQDRKRQLLDLAAQHQVLLLEDDAGSACWFERDRPQSLRAMDEHDVVIHTGSMTALITIGVRLGYVAATGQPLAELRRRKELADRLSSHVTQRACELCFESPRFERAVRECVKGLRTRRDAALEALGKYSPSGVFWSTPLGGFNIWVSFPDAPPRPLMYEASRRAGVTLLPDTLFTVDDTGMPAFRLTYAGHEPAAIGEAVRRLMTSWSQIHERVQVRFSSSSRRHRGARGAA